MSYLPSKKFIIVFLIILFVGVLFLFIRGQKSNSQTAEIEEKLENSLKIIAEQVDTLDSDGDGLKDWEEVLWKSDINKVDSDEDGYSDKEEVDGGYDPLDPDSNKETGKKKETESFADVIKISGQTNLTQEFAKSMGGQVIESGDLEGVDLSDPMALMGQEGSQAISEYLASFNIQLSEEEFNKTENNSNVILREYASAINEIFFTFNELVLKSISNNSFLAENNELINETKKLADTYGFMADEMKQVIVPSDFFDIHKGLTELFLSNQNAFSVIGEMDNDPLKVVLGMKKSEAINEEIGVLVIKFGQLMKEYGIS